MSTPTDLTIANVRDDAIVQGRKAFAAGTMRAPSLDLDHCPDDAPFTVWATGWLHGWDAANMAAPVPE